jgi:hypothetical protein
LSILLEASQRVLSLIIATPFALNGASLPAWLACRAQSKREHNQLIFDLQLTNAVGNSSSGVALLAMTGILKPMGCKEFLAAHPVDSVL